ncbi:MAG TPA: peptide methionine sulfoxide reductase [Cytophagales bacterium]|nr:peptide methionine sulfoxide reductase [Cytophagales bacterium]HAA20708.1 peptide methionine sulfoxide reductase [Cytophagales bacterium]HAP63753.1 peptide methionine sulfoxide reductase [Cytophagales bacterium]
MDTTSTVLKYIHQLPTGYSEGLYRGRKYGIVKEVFNAGRSYKVLARELKGTDLVSLNLYLTRKGEALKPCEMPAEKVIEFLMQVEVITNPNRN